MMKWHVDAGHAWLKVSAIDYPDVWQYGTGYGYRDGDYAYLEEDVEAPAFLVAHGDIDPQGISVVHHLDDAPCRMFDRMPERMQ